MKPFVLHDSIVIQAPIERCFLLSTSVEIVRMELKMTPVRGRTTGHVVGGDTVRWEGWQLGLPQVHESLIPVYEKPFHFQDRMIAGRFKTFEHDHWFEQTADGVTLRDELRFTMPLGPLGWMVGRVVMVPHIRKLLRRRFALLKRIAESDEWRRYVAE
jgi:ligand-binding SRPBCC domain-containing protein